MGNAPVSLLYLAVLLIGIYAGLKILRATIHLGIQVLLGLGLWLVLMKVAPGLVPPPSAVVARILGIVQKATPVIQHTMQNAGPVLQHAARQAGLP